MDPRGMIFWLNTLAVDKRNGVIYATAMHVCVSKIKMAKIVIHVYMYIGRYVHMGFYHFN
jgi:hypothetical protein